MKLQLFYQMDVLSLSNCLLNIYAYAHRSQVLSATICHGEKFILQMMLYLRLILISKTPESKKLFLWYSVPKLSIRQTSKSLLQKLKKNRRKWTRKDYNSPRNEWSAVQQSITRKKTLYLGGKFLQTWDTKKEINNRIFSLEVKYSILKGSSLGSVDYCQLYGFKMYLKLNRFISPLLHKCI